MILFYLCDGHHYSCYNTFSSLLICLVTNPSFMILLLGTAAAAGLGQDKPELVSATSQDHTSPASKWSSAILLSIFLQSIICISHVQLTHCYSGGDAEDGEIHQISPASGAGAWPRRWNRDYWDSEPRPGDCGVREQSGQRGKWYLHENLTS